MFVTYLGLVEVVDSDEPPLVHLDAQLLQAHVRRVALCHPTHMIRAAQAEAQGEGVEIGLWTTVM